MKSWTTFNHLQRVFSDQQQHTLRCALEVAAERYDENAKHLMEVAEDPAPERPNALISKRGARQIAEQFQSQARDARALIEHLDDVCTEEA